MDKTTEFKDKYERAKKDRQKYLDAILRANDEKKIVVGGPGTGKTYLFKEILKGKSNTLTLTFVNSLVEDLSLELYGLSEVRTLHSYARSELKRQTNKDIKIFPKLSDVIKEDANILLAKKVNFDEIFHNRDDESKYIKFYKNRKNYYGNFYGYSDIIFALVKYFETDRDKIPYYEQVIVDEFQDFNKLEVSLIELLSEKSPILLVGDDDQALYDFKHASTDYIRQKYNAQKSDYTPFNLPYCSRSTRVIVNAVNDIINSAVEKGHLRDRINKKFEYFKSKKRDKVSKQNPNIIYTQLYDRQIPWFIEKEIKSIANKMRDMFSVLIISPTRTKVRSIIKNLDSKGIKNIKDDDKHPYQQPTLLEGLKILLNHKNSNLGWRIVSEVLMPKEKFEDLLKKTYKEGVNSISEIMSDNYTEYTGEVGKLLTVLKKVKKNKQVEKHALNKLLEKIELNPYEKTKDLLRKSIMPYSSRPINPGLKKIPIKATTIQGSKGLSADYVFITHLEDRYFIQNQEKISDRDIYNFIVPLTRAKKGVFLISSNKRNGKKPTFLKWIKKDRINISNSD